MLDTMDNVTSCIRLLFGKLLLLPFVSMKVSQNLNRQQWFIQSYVTYPSNLVPDTRVLLVSVTLRGRRVSTLASSAEADQGTKYQKH